jgi:hypothetical protein
MGSLGMVIWAEVSWGRNKEDPATVAPKPMAAAFLKKSRRLGFPLLSLGDDIVHTSLTRIIQSGYGLLGLTGRTQRATTAEVENRLEFVSAHN